jgi:hypothetical protein
MDALLSIVRTCHRAIFILGVSAVCASCSTKPALYQELSSSRQLRATSPQTDQRVAFNTDLAPDGPKAYASVILEPVRIDRGKDSQFGSSSLCVVTPQLSGNMRSTSMLRADFA